jgi:hypothetical protein
MRKRTRRLDAFFFVDLTVGRRIRRDNEEDKKWKKAAGSLQRWREW